MARRLAFGARSAPYEPPRDLPRTRMETGSNRVLGAKKHKFNGLFFLRNEAKKWLKTNGNSEKGVENEPKNCGRREFSIACCEAADCP